MIVCHCHGLTDRQIEAAALRAQARGTGELGPDCPAARGCGGCQRAVDEIVRRSAPGPGTRKSASPRPASGAA